VIKTKDLVEFVREEIGETIPQTGRREYLAEIVVRLRAFDKLKEEIEKLLVRMSNA